jgi:hypothetical protein
MIGISEIERLRRLTNVQTDLVLQEVRLTEEAIAEYDEDDPNAFHVSRGRPTAIILAFPGSRRRR